MYNNRRLGQHLASSSFWALFGQAISTTTTLLFFAVLGRTLPPSSVGTYMLIMSVVMVATTVGTYGMQAIMTRTIAADLGARKFESVATTVLTGTTLVASLSLLIGILISGPTGNRVLNQIFDIPTNQFLLILVGCWLTLNCYHIITTETLKGFHDIKFATIYGAATKNSILILLVVLTYLTIDEMSVEKIILSICLSLITTSILATWKLKDHIKDKKAPASFSKFTAASLLRQSSPVFLTALTYQFITRAGVFILGYFATKNELALYGAALQMVVLVLIPLRILNSILPPIISNMYFNDKDHTRLEKTVRSVTTIATLPSIGVLVVIFISGERILSLTYGSYYGAAHLLVIILALGALSDVAFGPAGFTLTMTGHQTTLLRIIIFTGIITIFLSVIGGLIWGSVGVACMGAMSTIFQNMTTLYFAKKRTGILCCTFFSPSQLIGVFTGIKNLTRSLRPKGTSQAK